MVLDLLVVYVFELFTRIEVTDTRAYPVSVMYRISSGICNVRQRLFASCIHLCMCKKCMRSSSPCLTQEVQMKLQR